MSSGALLILLVAVLVPSPSEGGKIRGSLYHLKRAQQGAYKQIRMQGLMSYPLQYRTLDFLLKDPYAFWKSIQKRAREFRKGHPDQPFDFPIPEMRPTVDWIVQTLEKELASERGGHSRDPMSSNDYSVSDVLEMAKAVRRSGVPYRPYVELCNTFAELYEVRDGKPVLHAPKESDFKESYDRAFSSDGPFILYLYTHAPLDESAFILTSGVPIYLHGLELNVRDAEGLPNHAKGFLQHDYAHTLRSLGINQAQFEQAMALASRFTRFANVRDRARVAAEFLIFWRSLPDKLEQEAIGEIAFNISHETFDDGEAALARAKDAARHNMLEARFGEVTPTNRDTFYPEYQQTPKQFYFGQAVEIRERAARKYLDFWKQHAVGMPIYVAPRQREPEELQKTPLLFWR